MLVTGASPVVFLIRELLAAMPNHNMDNNKFADVEVWLVQHKLAFKICWTKICWTHTLKHTNTHTGSNVESGPPTKKSLVPLELKQRFPTTGCPRKNILLGFGKLY